MPTFTGDCITSNNISCNTMNFFTCYRNSETTNATIEVVFAALMLENYTEYVMKEGKALMSDLQDLEEEELAALIAGAGMTNREANQLRKVLKVESRLIAEPIIKTDRTDIQKNKSKSGGLTIAPVANTKSGLERASGKPDTSSGRDPYCPMNLLVFLCVDQLWTNIVTLTQKMMSCLI